MYRIAHMSPALIPEVRDIEETCFQPPWSAESFESSLAQPGTVALAALDEGGSVIGYALALAASETADLLKLAVIERARRQGVGGALLRAVIARLRANGASEMFLEVRASNQGAIRLYEREGFMRTGVRKGYYSRAEDGTGGEDGVVMRLGIK